MGISSVRNEAIAFCSGYTTSTYVLCRAQVNLTMRSTRTRMKSLEYSTQETLLSMNASRKSNKPTRMEYLSVSRTTTSIKSTSEVWLSTVSLWSASVTMFLPLNAAAGFCQCPNKGGVVTWGPSLMAILSPEKGPKQDGPVWRAWHCPGFSPQDDKHLCTCLASTNQIT